MVRVCVRASFLSADAMIVCVCVCVCGLLVVFHTYVRERITWWGVRTALSGPQ